MVEDCECKLEKTVWELQLDFIFLGSNFDNAAPQRERDAVADYAITP